MGSLHLLEMSRLKVTKDTKISNQSNPELRKEELCIVEFHSFTSSQAKCRRHSSSSNQPAMRSISAVLVALTIVQTSAFSGESQKCNTNRAPPLYSTSENDIASTIQELNGNNSEQVASLVRSVNYFISRECNYSCKFCFHTETNTNKFQFEQARYGLKILKDAGTQKINFAGGEPFLNPKLLGDLCRVASEELGMAVSIISNGSMITEKWMQTFGKYVDVLGVSVDSFDSDTNAVLGRGGDANNQHAERVLRVREMCSGHGILFKMNTVVNSLNWQEDMNEHVEKLDPYRWKAFQVLILEGENSGRNGDLRDATELRVSRRQFDAFCKRHAGQKALIPESNEVMQNSYLLLDEEMRFLDCSKGGKVPSDSILKVGVGQALEQAGFDHAMFEQRGGVYDWEREKSTDSAHAKP